ncbi:hypothetical protein J2Y73_002558 [Peribacillus frigoritolerans]|nr:hypothetical protein [Peribacillus frigoritolerans]
MERKVRDPAGAKRQGGSRTARGKQVPGEEINGHSIKSSKRVGNWVSILDFRRADWNVRYETPAGMRVQGRPRRHKAPRRLPGPPAESECLEWKSTRPQIFFWSFFSRISFIAKDH